MVRAASANGPPLPAGPRKLLPHTDLDPSVERMAFLVWNLRAVWGRAAEPPNVRDDPVPEYFWLAEAGLGSGVRQPVIPPEVKRQPNTVDEAHLFATMRPEDFDGTVLRLRCGALLSNRSASRMSASRSFLQR